MEKHILLKLPEDLHKEFKMKCIQNNQTIQNALIDLLKYYIITTDLKLKNHETKN